MPASVSLSGPSWSTRDGSDLDPTFGPERTGLVGRDGTGKSTLLRLIAGDLSPMPGHLNVPGSVVMMREDAQDRRRGDRRYSRGRAGAGLA